MNKASKISKFTRITKKKFFVILATIALAGLALRLGVSAELLHSYPSVKNPSRNTDMYTYQKFSRGIVEGTYDFSKGFYYQPFYYTVFLPIVYKIGDDNPWSIIIAQSILGLGTIWLTGLAFARIFGKVTGLVAAILVATNRYLIFYTPFTLIAVLQSFWVAILFWSVVVAFKSRKYWIWFTVGVIHGLSIITRGNVILLIPAVMIVVVYSFRNSLRYLSIIGMVYLMGVLLPQLPYSLINYHAHHRWIGASSAGDAVLALGNTPESPPGGREEQYGPGPMEYTESYYTWTHHASLDDEKRKPVVNQILHWALKEPLAFLELKFRMFLLFWNQSEVPNNVGLRAFLDYRHVPILNALFLFDFWIIGSLGLSGIIFSLVYHKKNPLILFGVISVGMYCVSIVLFYVLSRFRLPVFPLLCGFSGYAFITLARSTRHYLQNKRNGKMLSFKVVVLLSTVLIVGYGFDVYRVFWEKHVMKLVRPNGVQLILGQKATVKDHGPMTFGGWLTQSMHNSQRVTKEFVMPKRIEKGAKTYIRFPLFSPEGASFSLATIDVKSNELQNDEHHIVVEPGHQWVEHIINVDGFQSEGNIVKIDLGFKTPSDKLKLYFDSQRFYGRTRINGNVDKDLGEMVVEFIIEDLKTSD